MTLLSFISASARALVFATWVALPGLVYGDPARHAASGIEFPDEIVGFVRKTVVDYESKQPGLGFAFKYELHQELVADVYVFNGGRNDIPQDISHPLLAHLRAQTLSEIEQVAKSRGELYRRSGGGTVTVQTEQGPVAVLLDAMIISAPGQTRPTWSWLWTARNHVIKIRMTSQPGSRSFDAKAFREFYESVVRLTVPSLDAKRRANISLARSSSPTETVIWMAYGLGLSDWINKNQLANSAPDGPYVPSFEAEFHARQSQLRVWRELSEKGTPSLPYMEGMLRVASAGYLREYVWQYHRQTIWGAPSADLKMEAFAQWSAENLRDHVPPTGAQVVF